MASIEQLKSEISKGGGLARPNQFLVQLPSADSRALNILCTRASLPGKQILTHERRINMQFERVAYGFAVDDVSLSFLLTNDYSAKTYFDNWRRRILNEGSLTVNYKTEYQERVTIHQLKRPIAPSINRRGGSNRLDINIREDTVYSVELINAFPTTLQSIEFTNELDAIAEFTVQMSYTNFRVIESPSGVASITLNRPVVQGTTRMDRARARIAQQEATFFNDEPLEDF
tara:strand:+ start:383 stop:1072 length:690 start_codon:yes stop_codon:yes gene_type:complete